MTKVSKNKWPLLGIIMFMFCACNNDDKLVSEIKADDVKFKQQELDVCEHTRDSVLNALNYDGTLSAYDIRQEIDELSRIPTKADELKKEILAKRGEIAEQTQKKLDLLAQKYRLSGIELVVDDSSLDDSCTFGFRFKDAEDLDARQNEISNKAKDIVKVADNEFVRVALNIAKKYKDYYPIFDDANQKYQKAAGYPYAGHGEGGWRVDPADFCWPRYLVTIRRVSVYDSRLPVDFFGDPDCQYKLVNVAKNKWQVKKIHKNGRVENSAVFQDNKNWEVVDFRDHEACRDEFKFEAGKNQGVHIYYEEVVSQVSPSIQNDTVTSITPERTKKIAELQKQLTEAERMESIRDEANRVAQQKQSEIMQCNKATLEAKIAKIKSEQVRQQVRNGCHYNNR